MANCCCTNMHIYCDDTEKLNNLNSLIDEWTSKNYMPNGFGHHWLGNIVLGSGVGTVDTNKETDLRCRGTLLYKDICCGELTIETETAGSPMMEMWIKIIDKYLPDANLFYTAEEPGSGIFYTNDPDYVDKYVIDSWNENIESNWEASEENVRELLQELLETDETDVKKLIDMFYYSDLEEDISINQWEYVSEYELS